jgi:hypothetical protein
VATELAEAIARRTALEGAGVHEALRVVPGIMGFSGRVAFDRHHRSPIGAAG